MPNIGLGLNIQCGAALSPFSAEYQAVLNYARSNNFILPSPSEQLLQNQLVVNLKSNGIWSKLDAFYMFANTIYTGATYAGTGFALINWKNPSQNYGTTNTTMPTISAAAGFTGNASNMAVNLNFTPSTQGVNFKDPNGSYGVLLGTASTTSTSSIMGASAAINKIRQSVVGTLSSMQLSGTSFDGQVLANSSFVYLNRKTDATSANTGIYVNGIRTQGFGATWTADSSSFNILRYGDSALYGNSQIKVAFIGGDLSSTSPINIPTTFSSLMTNYISSLNLISSFTTYSAMAKEMGYTPISPLTAFETRVLADGAVIEAQSCLNTTINTLVNINLA